jgi:hypothetical protein
MTPFPPGAIARLRATHPELAADLAKRASERADREPSEVLHTTEYDATFNAPVRPEDLVFSPPT